MQRKDNQFSGINKRAVETALLLAILHLIYEKKVD